MIGWVWLGAALMAVIVELLSGDFFFLMLGIGAAASCICAFFWPNLWWLHILMFAAVSSVLVLTVRPLIKKKLEASTPRVAFNVSRYEGREGVTTSPVSPAGGTIMLDGERWSATSDHDIPRGIGIRVIEVRGATAVVAPVSR